MDLKRWKLFRELDSSLTSVCKLAKIIHCPEVGFLVLQNDDVYAVTGRCNLKWLGYGNNSVGGYQVSKIEWLCGKGITNFYGYTGKFVALARDGSVYSWPSTEGYDPCVDGTPEILFPGANGSQVCEVSCGTFHALCLTIQGEVYGWGDDDSGQLGSGSRRGEDEGVTKISSVSDDISIVQIAAGDETSFALDSRGKVWSWGSCGSVLLGYKASEDQLSPKLIKSLPKIKKIAVGSSHVLALSEIGELYFWGKFEGGRVRQVNDEEIIITPIAIRISREAVVPVIDIASVIGAQFGVFKSDDKVYLWGIWFGQRISTPIATEFSSIEEAFACAQSPRMIQPIRITAKPPGVINAWTRAFNDKSTADVRFFVEDEVLHAHSVFLKLRSDYFRSMFADGWEESKNEFRKFKVQGFSFRIFKAFMYFLYNDRLIEPDMSVVDLTDLMKAADYYGDSDLLLACESNLKPKLTPANACLVYAYAVKFNIESLQNHTVEFIVSMLKEVVNSEECAKMDSDLKTKLMIQIANAGMIPSPKKRRTL